MKSGGPGGLQMLFYLGYPSYYSDEIRWSRRFTDAVLLGTPVIYSDEIRWSRRFTDAVYLGHRHITLMKSGGPGGMLLGTPDITLMKSGGPGGLQMLFYLGHRSYYSGPPDFIRVKSGGPGGLQMLFYLGRPSYYSDEIRWSRRLTDAVNLGHSSFTLMKSGGPGGLQMLFYLGRPSYYSDEIRWSRRFTDAVLLGTPVILLWWNQVVQEVYRCCFTWDTRHITLMKSGGPGGLQMLFYLGHSSYYSDEIRWSRRLTYAVLLGTSVILLWWNQVVQEVCRCCFTWDGHITLMKSGGPGGLQMLFTWDTLHITLMKSGGPGGLQMLFYLGHSSYYSDEIRWSRRFVQMLFYLGHPSYYSDEIRWSRRFVDAVLLGTPVILLWWNQVVQEVYRCCFTWDTKSRHNSDEFIRCGQGGLTDAVLLGTPSYYYDEIGGPGGLQMLFYLGRPSYYSDDEIRGSRRFVDAVVFGTPVIYSDEIRWSRRFTDAVLLGTPSYYSDEIRWSRRFVDAVWFGTPVILLWWFHQVVQEVNRCCFTWDTRHITLMKSGGPGGL